MPRKPFEDTPYDPIAADLAREVAAAGRPSIATLERPISSPAARPETTAFEPPPASPRARQSRDWPTASLARHPRSQFSSHRAAPPSPPHSTNRDQDPPATQGPSPTITKRFVVSRAEDADLNAFLLRLQQATGAKVPLSVIVRALITLAMQSEPSVIELLVRHPVRLPSTHDTLALGEFEALWTSVLARALATRVRTESEASRFAAN